MSDLAIIREYFDQVGEHPGPCLNFENQDPDEFSGWDSCYLCVEMAGRRRDAAVAALTRLEAAPTAPEQGPDSTYQT